MAETNESAGGRRQFLVKTPAKLIITGEHAVVYGQLALAASVDLLTEIHVTLHHPTISIHFDDLKFHWTLPVEKLPTASIPLVAAELVDQLQSILPTDADPSVRMSLSALCFLYYSIVRPEPPHRGFEMRVHSSIPIGAGLGSSAAFSVGLSTAFHRIAHSNSSAGEAAELFIPDLESINNWALQCEKMFHATPSGIDNAVCTYGGLVKFQNRKVAGFMNVPEARILLVDTQISRQTKLLVEGVRQKHDRLPAVIDPILEAIGNISHQMVEVMQHPEDTNYYSIIRELISTNHWLLASLGVSVGALDAIHNVARIHGQAGKLTGAGGGGLAFVWLDPDLHNEQLDALQKDLAAKNCRCWPARLGVKGVQVEEC